jgi:aspartyl-tRNA(Asn)/glutamyl-tRNA(Gln) amidotransferase subunit A
MPAVEAEDDMTRPTACERLEQALARIDDPKGEGARACLTVYRDAARAAAEAADKRARLGVSLGPLDGAILTIKDLFDVAGEITRAGSKLLAEHGTPAAEDAPVVRRLRQAGAVIVGKTNMTEFAFSGIGANPHFGTPGNPADRARAPGGSTAGGAVAVADGMCEITIGSDTGGSCRTPAAFCGIVGYKPSRQRIPTGGAFPLSFTLDSIGPMARSVADCEKADAVMAGETYAPCEPAPLVNLRIGVVQGLPLDRLDEPVARGFEAALKRLSAAGARLIECALPEIDEMIDVNTRYGGIAPAEAFAVHRERLERHGDMVDPHVRRRIERARNLSAADYIEMIRRRNAIARAVDARLAGFDMVVMPTAPVVAPVLAELEQPEEWGRRNAMALRNTSMWNFFDACSMSLPLPRDGRLPAGLMLSARNGGDARLFRIAAAVERVLT